MDLVPGKFHWLIDATDQKRPPLGFVRGIWWALVVDGTDGSRMSDHRERWDDRLAVLLKTGYVDEAEARKRRIVPQTWTPPPIAAADAATARILGTPREQPVRGRVYWFFNPADDTRRPVGLVRGKSAAFVVNSPTGSYLTGHGEGWASKWEEFFLAGFVEEAQAMKDGLVPSSWTPPALSPNSLDALRLLGSGRF
ncbi:MAG: hypothetical protein NTW19_08890 [Planctomycetota bacterium]|nr:hypothetical protein [Planctomycetota bacterium]